MGDFLKFLWFLNAEALGKTPLERVIAYYAAQNYYKYFIINFLLAFGSSDHKISFAFCSELPKV